MSGGPLTKIRTVVVVEVVVTVVTENDFESAGFNEQLAVLSANAVFWNVRSLAVPATKKPEVARLTETSTGPPAKALPAPTLIWTAVGVRVAVGVGVAVGVNVGVLVGV